MYYHIRKTNAAEKAANMPYVTSSMIEAVNTCPRWGIVHNVLGKRFVSKYRQMALEAGSLMHDVFMGLNLLQVGIEQNLVDHMHFHGQQLFGKERWQMLSDTIIKIEKSTDFVAIERFVFEIIATSGFYDDTYDRNRTLSNLEHCAAELTQYYLSALMLMPIYIENRNNPEARIGIEISLDAVFEIHNDDGSYITSMRGIGLGDAVYQNPETKRIVLGEYKTASSMNDAWRLAFDTRHQISFYNALLQAYFGKQDSFQTILIGSAIPVRKTSLPVQHFNVDRNQDMIEQMLNSFLFTQNIITDYKDKPLQAPMFTHSCNRYFRPCSMLDLCNATKHDREFMFENMETVVAASPSEQKALMRNM